MASFSTSGVFAITIVNHSNTEINYDIRSISGDPTNYGSVSPGATATPKQWSKDGSLEYGNVAVVGIGQFGQPQSAPAPGVRFWSGNDPFKQQFINLLAGNGWEVTGNTSLLSQVTGNRFRVTVDGGGQGAGPGAEPNTAEIFFQVYNA
jgi:hypothetical protein